MKKVVAFFVVLFVLNVAFGGLTTQYVVNYWVPKYINEKFHADFLPCAVAGLFLGEVSIPAAVITWLVESASTENDQDK